MRALLLALVLTASMPVDAAACHRFHTWRYPFPQRCGHQAGPGRPLAVRLASLAPPPIDARPGPPEGLGIPIPALGDWLDFVPGDADVGTRARLLLRAASENAHGH